ncbi:MAG: ankyrin repeat domain-containing protein, partial [Candidatus Micrarchaeota archaeon]|nr:ankyrin repeat domain-containing protein [Candidatus Micrarchaeota archaeon]
VGIVRCEEEADSCFAMHRNIEAVRFLIENGADIYITDNVGRTAFARVVHQFDKELFDLLGGNDKKLINMKDYDGYTPLMSAASSGDLQAVRYLIKNGADINAKNNNGLTALSLAIIGSYSIEGAHWFVAELLLKNGAKFDRSMIPSHYRGEEYISSALRYLERKGLLKYDG